MKTKTKKKIETIYTVVIEGWNGHFYIDDILSFHRTKKGAEKAIPKHLASLSKHVIYSVEKEIYIKERELEE